MAENTAAMVYFERPGPANTDRVLGLAAEAARSLGLRRIVLASTRGYTALRALELCAGLEIIAVGSYRSRSNPRLVEEFKAKGGRHFFAYEDIDYDYPQFVQDAYRSFAGEGGKVAMEVVVCAVRAGLVKEGERVIGIGGTFPGADTAFVVVAARDFPRLRVAQMLCAPRQA